MKQFVSIALVAASLAVSARAITVGADVGYLIDSEEAYYSARLGHVVKSDDSLNHQFEIEAGYSSQKESGAKSSLLPVTINYRAESIAANKLGFYYGAGAGFARTRMTLPGSGLPSISDSGTSFAAQGFVGLTYQASPTTSLHVGAKYIWIDEVDLLGSSYEIGDDFVFSAGVSVKF